MKQKAFRAWDKYREKMFPVKRLEFFGSGEINVIVDASDCDGDVEEYLDGCILMEFIGLRDNTAWRDLTEAEREKWMLAGNMPSEWGGEEIYEEDIVEWSLWESVPQKTQVEWDLEHLCYRPLSIYYAPHILCEGMHNIDNDGWRIRIIGNTFEGIREEVEDGCSSCSSTVVQGYGQLPNAKAVGLVCEDRIY